MFRVRLQTEQRHGAGDEDRGEQEPKGKGGSGTHVANLPGERDRCRHGLRCVTGADRDLVTNTKMQFLGR